MSTGRHNAELLERAEQFDANGRHDDAIDTLALATQTGDVEAATRLGKRLIVGNNAPLLPPQGAGFLIEAFNKGGAEAASRLAVLAAAGVYVESSLPQALELVRISAERGWLPAQDQLIALTPDRDLADAASEQIAHAAYWRQVAGTVDLSLWQSASDGITLSESPLIRSFGGFVAEPICDWMIEQSQRRLSRALVYDPVEGKDYAGATRTNSWAQFDLMDSELIHLLIQLRMQAACGIPLHNMEANAILNYRVGEEITNHFDFVDPKTPNYHEEIERNGQRILTFLVYLNDDYGGGETEFPELEILHKGRRGEGLYFVNTLENNEPDLRTVHAGRPPTSGEKWIVSQFVRGRRVLGVPEPAAPEQSN